jgi:3-deoxy-D-manno-octulosonic-acid transferase
MSAAYLLYNMLLSLSVPGLLAAAAAGGGLRGRWRERLGLVPVPPPGGRARIWMHAVSFGEVQVAATLMAAMRRQASDLRFFLTTGTPAGLLAAREAVGPDVPITALPLDAYGGPARALRRLSPDLLVIIETEIWPNLLKAAHDLGIKTMLANGRISAGSYRLYRRFRFLFREALGRFDLMAMNHALYRDRIVSLGADPRRVVITGSAKYDALLDRVDPARAERYRQELGLAPNRRILVAGSTRSGEEAVLLEVFQRLKRDFPDLALVLAPRHVERAGELVSLIHEKGLSVRRRSAGPRPVPDGADVVLVDVMGELFFLYGLGEAAFCGGSLVPLGGQNPLEPAAWAKPVLYGPFMDNFPEAIGLLEESGAGMMVEDDWALYRRLAVLLKDPELARSRGLAGQEALRARPKSAERTAALALGLVGLDKSREPDIVIRAKAGKG